MLARRLFCKFEPFTSEVLYLKKPRRAGSACEQSASRIPMQLLIIGHAVLSFSCF